MSVIPYLTFPGTCRAAITFYASVFDTEIDMKMEGRDMPDFPVPPGMENHIAHCSMKLAGGEIYASDTFMGDPEPMAGCSVMVAVPDTTHCEAIFEKLAVGGKITMPFQATFWSAGFGTLNDQFGTKWMISSEDTPTQT